MTKARQGRGREGRWLFIVSLTAMSMSTPALASNMQRMMLAPAGCYVLAPGGYDDASAYCLDQSRMPPAEGSILSTVAASVDEASVKIAGAPPLTLAQALAQQVIRIEGRGNDQHLRIRNLTDRAMEICIDGPTVVMGNGDAYTGDVDKIRRQLAQLLAPGHGDPDAAAHAAVQQRLWDVVNEIDREESRAFARGLASPSLLPSSPQSPFGTSSRAQCADRAHGADVKVCMQ